jgi:hypothetical protein
MRLRNYGLTVLIVGLGTAQSTSASDVASGSSCAPAALTYLNSLDADNRRLAAQPFDEKKRRKWTYFPNVPQLDIRKEGAPIGGMNNAQRIAAHRLIECGLSSQGYQKAAGIMRLDDILAMTDQFREMTEAGNPPVSSGGFFLAVFGDPQGDEPWGWQLEGHHLALNFTVVDGEIVYAPAFMGADPVEVPDGTYAGWRMLGPEIDKAVLLAQTLTTEQRDKAILADEIPERLFTGPGRGDALKNYAGIAASELTAEQNLLLYSLIAEYVNNAVEPVSAAHRTAIGEEFPANTWFSWMGPTEAGEGIYYRVHSPALLIEFVTARNRQSKELEPNPNHVHTIFRYPGNDFGADLLKQHYETSPDHQHD